MWLASPSTCAVSLFFFFQAEDGIRDLTVTGVQTCALPISSRKAWENRVGECSSRSPLDSRITTIRIGSGTPAALMRPASTIHTLSATDRKPWRSEERRVGKECRTRRSPTHHKKEHRKDVDE